MERLKRGAHETLQRLHDLQRVSLQSGNHDAARGIGTVITQLQDLDRRIGRIALP